ncbi:MAG: ribosomal protein [Actinomycetota bacterium]
MNRPPTLVAFPVRIPPMAFTGTSDWKKCVMASVCEVCGKGPSWGMNVSHSHRRTKRRWNPNIQRVRALVSGTPRRLNVCTGCIKSGKIVKAG